MKKKKLNLDKEVKKMLGGWEIDCNPDCPVKPSPQLGDHIPGCDKYPNSPCGWVYTEED